MSPTGGKTGWRLLPRGRLLDALPVDPCFHHLLLLAADFGAAPVAFDHGALLPLISVFTPRAGKDGVNVTHCGTQEAVDQFVKLLTAE